MFDIGKQEVKILTVGNQDANFLDVKNQNAWTNGWKPGPNTVVYWPLTSNTKLNDLSKRGNHLICSSSDTSSLFGTYQGVDCWHNTSYSPYCYINTIAGFPTGATKFTWNFWIYAVSQSHNIYFLATRGGSSERKGIHIYSSSHSSNPGRIRYYDTDVSGISTTNVFGRWHNIVVTYDGNGVDGGHYRLYVDSVLEYTTDGVSPSSAAPSSTYPFVLNERSKGESSYNFSGGISRFIIESGKCWIQKEITKYFGETKAIYGIS